MANASILLLTDPIGAICLSLEGVNRIHVYAFDLATPFSAGHDEDAKVKRIRVQGTNLRRGQARQLISNSSTHQIPSPSNLEHNTQEDPSTTNLTKIPNLTTADTKRYLAPITTPRIVGGSETPVGRYPYSVALFDTSFSTYSRCGGTLIAPDIILTAAHCLLPIDFVRINQHDINDPNDAYEEFTVIQKVQHPNYRPRSYNYDFGLMKLSGVSSYQPISLNDDPNVPVNDKELTVIGWGTTSVNSYRPAEVLLESNVSYMPNDACIEKSRYPTGQVTNAMMCAAAEGRDACGGDSGGPLILTGENSKQDALVGVVSFGIGCANADFPGVYARVSYQVGWIRDTVCDVLSDPTMSTSESSCAYVSNCHDVDSFTTASGDVKDCAW
eukprot:CAMPEP_0195517014 /NCGR_PEP_ID=MMETSP0794_2-20130614/9509_1 /TAXON_ID=515487 /ORGANISM="Stephanopyxis turris, Strain CCMP 815" /LENGTH=384 /DNA_ID=CAMNT_0040645743 /DNA_START=153 /DNA_END=1305 /DNA_ORIENTATION=+